MPKQEVGSTKWLGNKMKAKGLQKLRWYCQMCQKQCRDENGFKCHRMSDGHQRQMQLFVQDPNTFMDEFSQEFEKGFMQLMSHTYRAQRVLANTVYCDYISNRHHTHMNATIWVTLSNFVQYLGRTNQCSIDKTPKGWYITYIDNSPEAKLRAKQALEREQHAVDEEERHEAMLAAQIESTKGDFQESEFTELQRQEGDAPIAFNMTKGGSSSSKAEAKLEQDPKKGGGPAAGGGNVLEQAFAAHGSSRGAKDPKKREPERELSAMEQIRLEHEAAKRRKVEAERAPSSSEEADTSPWLSAGLIVKVMHQDLADGKYYRKKGKIAKVHNQYTADVRMTESGDLLRIQQEMLETVIPNVGKVVLVVKGTHKGHRATMRSVNMEKFCVGVELDDGTMMEGLGYDEVCKVEE